VNLFGQLAQALGELVDLHREVGVHTTGANGELVGTVSVIDTAACNGAHLAACHSTTVAIVPTGEYPDGLAVDPRTHTLYVANDGDNDVSVIDTAKCDATNKIGCETR
jgi:YVTN family beta-propeller protein